MKVLYVDIEIGGHHQTYLKALMDIPGKENVLVLPEKIEGLNAKQYVFQKTDFFNKKLPEYYKWAKEVKGIIKKEKPDVIHFLYGDVFYKYFGLGLESLKKKYKVVNTIHALKKGWIGIVSLKRIMRLSSVGVVHTDAIFNEVKDAGIENVVHIEYPHFSTGYEIDKAGARKYYDLSEDAFVLGCLGGTRYDKGLDILLKAMQGVTGDFELLVAGSEDAIKREKIEELARTYRDQVKLHLKFLTDEEYDIAIQAVDAIVLPYRKTFNGASGPLGEGVAKGKMIIAANHGSLGDTVEKNHLGYTFESENVEALSKVLNTVVQSCTFKYDTSALMYMNTISINTFRKKYRGIYRRYMNERARERK